MAHTNLWSSENHALGYLAIADTIPHRTEREKVLLELVPKTVRNILDLGTGDGRLLSLLKIDRPEVESVAVDFSGTMLEAAKKRFAEIFDLLNDGGVFCNLEHVSSPTLAIHAYFRKAIGIEDKPEDPSNKLFDVETQLNSLREIGYTDVDCYWKWLELALLVGYKPNGDPLK
ncbi:methyltransferase [Calothrix sp. HK-06]|nr:methyltransferase [Calothrix sp. HK-06]